MKRKLHAAAGTLAFGLIACFSATTVLVELLGTPAQIATAKTAILYAMAVLVPALATAGVTGASLGKGWRLPVVTRKTARMILVAANGLLILLPSAVYLALSARSGPLNGLFYTVQAVELLAGAVNITLLGLNLRDGLALARRRAATA